MQRTCPTMDTEGRRTHGYRRQTAVRAVAELEKVEGMPSGTLRRAGDEILAAVAAARRGAAPDPEQARAARARRTTEVLAQCIAERVAECAGSLGVAAETIASKKELSAVVIAGERDTRLSRAGART